MLPLLNIKKVFLGMRKFQYIPQNRCWVGNSNTEILKPIQLFPVDIITLLPALRHLLDRLRPIIKLLS